MARAPILSRRACHVATTSSKRPAAAGSDAVPDVTGEHAAMISVLAKAHTTRAVTAARLSELNYKEAAGILIKRDVAKRAGADVGRLVVSWLRGFPMRLGPIVASIDDGGQIAAIIAGEIDLLCTELLEQVANI